MQSVAAVSIKDQEAEAEKDRSKGRPGPQQRVLNSEGVLKPAVVADKPFPASSGGVASAAWSNRSRDAAPPSYDRPSRDSYNDRPSRDSYNDRPSYGSRGGDGDDFGRGGDRPERRERPEVPFPTQAPYVLYLSGLPYEGTEQDVLDLLPDFLGEDLNAQVKHVKVPIKDGRLRHAFIEFNDADSLRSALLLTGKQFMGRSATCLVADQPAGRRDDDRTRWGPSGGSSGGFSSGFGRRDNFGDRDNGPRSGGGYQRPARFDERPVERKPLNLAPRSESASVDGGADKPKADPFGGATASVRDIYADKPKPAPVARAAPAATSSARAPAKPQEESRADSRDSWRSKDKDFKPAFRGGYPDRDTGRDSGRESGVRSAAGAAPKRNNQAQEGEWKSAGGGAKPQQQRTKAAPLSSNANSGEASNPFDLLGNE